MEFKAYIHLYILQSMPLQQPKRFPPFVFHSNFGNAKIRHANSAISNIVNGNIGIVALQTAEESGQ
jgi:hypothetical protein